MEDSAEYFRMCEDAVERHIFLDQVARVSRATLLTGACGLPAPNRVLERRSQPGQPIQIYNTRQHNLAESIEGFLLGGRQRRFSDAALFETSSIPLNFAIAATAVSSYLKREHEGHGVQPLGCQASASRLLL